VCHSQGLRYLPRDANRSRHAQWAFVLQNLADVFALDQLHHDEGAPIVGVVEVVHPDRIGMPQFSGDYGFGLETLQEFRIPSDAVVHDLDSAKLIESDVPASVYNTHPPNTDPGENFVFIANDHPWLEFVRGLQAGLIGRTRAVVGGERFVASRAVFHRIP
jgi:hypothetical protein